jgi:diacylglycerol kinase (ATP)
MSSSASSTGDTLRAKSRLHSFLHAFAGWRYVLRTQRNTWIHAAFSIMAVVLGFWLGLSPIEWALVIIVMGVVWVTEFTNTAIEAVVDLVSPDFHPLAKIAKDVAAAAVLVSACTAVVVGLLVLGPPLVEQVILLALPPR